MLKGSSHSLLFSFMVFLSMRFSSFRYRMAATIFWARCKSRALFFLLLFVEKYFINIVDK
nr:MAG TPA: hypothetical protein [Caudoviricetes sp.]